MILCPNSRCWAGNLAFFLAKKEAKKLCLAANDLLFDLYWGLCPQTPALCVVIILGAAPPNPQILAVYVTLRAYARDVPPTPPNGGLVDVASGLPDAYVINWSRVTPEACDPLDN